MIIRMKEIIYWGNANDKPATRYNYRLEKHLSSCFFNITNKYTFNITSIYHNSGSLHNPHSYMFRHFHVIIRECHICPLLSYLSS